MFQEVLETLFNGSLLALHFPRRPPLVEWQGVIPIEAYKRNFWPFQIVNSASIRSLANRFPTGHLKLRKFLGGEEKIWGPFRRSNGEKGRRKLLTSCQFHGKGNLLESLDSPLSWASFPEFMGTQVLLGNNFSNPHAPDLLLILF